MKLPPRLWSDLIAVNNFKSYVSSLLAILKEKVGLWDHSIVGVCLSISTFEPVDLFLWNYDSVTDVNLWGRSDANTT
jgi:hypothetical protein